jgi:hypothetical protein
MGECSLGNCSSHVLTYIADDVGYLRSSTPFSLFVSQALLSCISDNISLLVVQFWNKQKGERKQMFRKRMLRTKICGELWKGSSWPWKEMAFQGVQSMSIYAYICEPCRNSIGLHARSLVRDLRMYTSI